MLATSRFVTLRMRPPPQRPIMPRGSAKTHTIMAPLATLLAITLTTSTRCSTSGEPEVPCLPVRSSTSFAVCQAQNIVDLSIPIVSYLHSPKCAILRRYIDVPHVFTFEGTLNSRASETVPAFVNGRARSRSVPA
jgi:hypothetical protein